MYSQPRRAPSKSNSVASSDVIDISDDDKTNVVIDLSSDDDSFSDVESVDLPDPDTLLAFSQLSRTTSRASTATSFSSQASSQASSQFGRSSLLDALDAVDLSSSQSQRSDATAVSKKRKASHDTDDEGASTKKAKKAKDREEAAAIKEAKRLEREAKKKEKEREKEADKERKKEAKAQEKIRKEQEKLSKKEHQAVNKLVSDRKLTLVDITLNISSSLRNSPSFSPLLPPLLEKLAEHSSTLQFFDCPIPNVVRWQKKIKSKFNEFTREWDPVPEYVRVEGTYLLYYSAAELIENIDRLRQIFTTIRARLHLSSKHQIFLMVDGLRRYCKSKRNVKMEGIERALAGIQVAERCFIIHTDGVTETVDWFYDLSADIGIKPHKLVERSHLPFCSNTKAKVGSDTKDTFRKMLECIPHVTESAADGVLGTHPTLRHLFEAYEAKGNDLDRDLMLKDIVIKLNKDHTRSERTINQAMSKRIGGVLCGDDSLALVKS